MFKKLLVVCAPAVVFFALLMVFVFFSTAKNPDVLPGPSDETQKTGEPGEKDFATSAENQTEPDETTATNAGTDFAAAEIAYDAPYAVEEIKEIFKEDKSLLEKIKNTEMPKGCNYFQAAKTVGSDFPQKIEFYGFDGAGGVRHISYDLSENGEYGEIYGFFKKYAHIGSIHAIDPGSAEYEGENLIAQFGLQIDVSAFSDRIPWAEIRYNRNSGEIQEKITSEYMTIPLDEHWYYIYSNIYR